MYLRVLLFCVALVYAQPAARTVYAAQTGLLNNQACYIVSAEYAVVPNTSVKANVFAAAMGLNIPGTSALYPWTALAYVRGNIDATTYPSTGQLDTVTVDASANVVAWSYVAIGEFCDQNGIEGYQPAGDRIINYYTAPQALLYSEQCGQGPDPITGDNSYYASIQTATGQYFNVTCRVFASNTSTFRNGRIVSPYDFKCDVRIDYTTLWSTNATQINGCADNKRKIGLLVNVAGASFDIDVNVANLNSAPANSPDGGRITFGGGKLQFAWDNYYYQTSNFSAVVGTTGAATATYIQSINVNTQTQIFGVQAIEQIIFSFDAPKSANTLYYWDPTTTVMNPNSSSALSTCLALVILSVLAFFF